MLGFFEGTTHVVDIIVRMLLAVFGFLVVKDLVRKIAAIRQLRIYVEEAAKARSIAGLSSVQGEVTSFIEKRLGRMDTQYNVNVVYTVGNIRYYKEIILLNRGSLRVGQKLDMLYDSIDPSVAAARDGQEKEAVNKLIGMVIFRIVVLIIDLFMIFNFNTNYGKMGRPFGRLWT